MGLVPPPPPPPPHQLLQHQAGAVAADAVQAVAARVAQAVGELAHEAQPAHAQVVVLGAGRVRLPRRQRVLVAADGLLDLTTISGTERSKMPTDMVVQV